MNVVSIFSMDVVGSSILGFLTTPKNIWRAAIVESGRSRDADRNSSLHHVLSACPLAASWSVTVHLAGFSRVDTATCPNWKSLYFLNL